MAFDSLSEKLQNVFKNLRGKGRLTEADVKAALKEVKLALLEADVSFKVVKQFIKAVEARAVGTDVMESLTPGQMVIKIVNEEMVNLMGSETTEIKLRPSNEITVIMMTGLQGAGKTTTAAKLAGKFKIKGRKVLLTACDVYRPAAIKQLQVNGEKQGVEVFSMGDQHKPVDIAKAAMEHAKKQGMSVVILDTAGRLHIDEAMMEELQEIKVRLKPFMVSECGRHGITRVYFMLTNIMDESSDVIYYGEGSEEMGKIAFQQEPEDKCFHLKGVVSRKKQMIPAMMEAAQIMANDFN